MSSSAQIICSGLLTLFTDGKLPWVVNHFCSSRASKSLVTGLRNTTGSAGIIDIALAGRKRKNPKPVTAQTSQRTRLEDP